MLEEICSARRVEISGERRRGVLHRARRRGAARLGAPGARPGWRGGDEARGGPPARLEAVTAASLPGWPQAEVSLPCDHAGLLLLFPAMAQLDLPGLVRSAGYPSTRALSSWQSAGSLLLAKCARKARVHHIGSLTDDAGPAFTLGLTSLPKATHLGTYSPRD